MSAASRRESARKAAFARWGQPEVSGTTIRALGPREASTAKVAKALSIREDTLRRLARNSQVPFDLTPSGRRLFNIDEVTAALAARNSLGRAARRHSTGDAWLVDATELDSWAERRDCQQDFPLAIRILIAASTRDIREIEFRTGEGVNLAGWDGRVLSDAGTPWVPEGVSGWELGSDEDILRKANSDYDNFGRVSSETSPGGDTTNPTTAYHYLWDGTAPNRTLVSRRDDAGTSSGTYTTLDSWEWTDGLGRTIEAGSEAECATVKRDIISHTVYNTVGYMSEQSIPYFKTLTSCTDETGNSTSSTLQYGYHAIDTGAGTTEYLYDAIGRQIQVTEPGDGTAPSVSTAEYDGYTTISIDANDHKTESDQDAYGRSAAVREYSGTCVSCGGGNNYALYATTTFAYDVLDRQMSVTDPFSNLSETLYDFDATTGLATVTTDDPDRGVWTNTYNDDGSLLSREDARGVLTEYVYDSLGRETLREYSGTGVTDPDVQFFYDETPDTYTHGTGLSDGYPKGHLTRMIDDAGEAFYSYDPRGRMTAQRRAVAGDLTNKRFDLLYSYDSLGRQTGITYPDSEAVTTTYDPYQGFVASVVGSSTYLSSTTANAAGQLTQLVNGNGVTVTQTYRASDLRLTGISAIKTSGSVLLYSQSYDYDELGNIKEIDDGVEGSTQTMNYDHRNRLDYADLDKSSGPDESYDYAYDELGNLTLKQEGSSSSYNDLAYSGSRPHAVTLADAPGTSSDRAFTYDANGNTVTEERPGTGYVYREYVYNAEGLTTQIVESPDDDPLVTTYVYDGQGALTRKCRATCSPSYYPVYVAGVFEKDLQTGAVTKQYVADGKPLAMSVGSNVSWLGRDYLGSTALVTNSSGNTVSRLQYFPYGGTRTETNPAPTDRLFTGQQRQSDAENVYLLGARMYNTAIGRMPQSDSILVDGFGSAGLNRYSYAVNNPTNFTDPSGHEPEGYWGYSRLRVRVELVDLASPTPFENLIFVDASFLFLWNWYGHNTRGPNNINIISQVGWTTGTKGNTSLISKWKNDGVNSSSTPGGATQSVRAGWSYKFLRIPFKNRDNITFGVSATLSPVGHCCRSPVLISYILDGMEPVTRQLVGVQFEIWHDYGYCKPDGTCQRYSVPYYKSTTGCGSFNTNCGVLRRRTQ